MKNMAWPKMECVETDAYIACIDVFIYGAGRTGVVFILTDFIPSYYYIKYYST